MLHWFAKRMTEASREARKDERGFTLIELLVVIIIIGILAAIAIPTFLSQRDRANDANAESTARNAATAAQTYAVDNDGDFSGISVAELNTIEPSLPDTANADPFSTYTVAADGTDNFLITVEHQDGTTTFISDNQGTREQPAP